MKSADVIVHSVFTQQPAQQSSSPSHTSAECHGTIDISDISSFNDNAGGSCHFIAKSCDIVPALPRTASSGLTQRGTTSRYDSFRRIMRARCTHSFQCIQPRRLRTIACPGIQQVSRSRHNPSCGGRVASRLPRRIPVIPLPFLPSSVFASFL